MGHSQHESETSLGQAHFHFSLIKKRIISLQATVEQLSKIDLSLDYVIDLSLDYVIGLDHAYLNIRKIIEELLLLSVSAHETAGSDLSIRLRKEWNAIKIMKGLERINPRFFPDAIKIVPSADEDTAGRFVSVDDDYLTRGFAAEMYNLCGTVLHASNKRLAREVASDRYVKAKRFDLEVRRLLETFEIDVNGEGFMVLGHLNLEINGPPKLFSASSGD